MSAAAERERKAIVEMLDARIAALRDAPHVRRELRELRNDIVTAKHRTAPAPLEIVRRPRMIGNLPDEDRAAAIAADARKADRQQAAGTLPTPIPRGAQR